MPRILAALLALCLPLAAVAEPIAVRPSAVSTVDGDTIRVSIRLVGYDTPEVTRPRCAEEASLGAEAERALHAIIRSARTLTIDILPHSDRYGRLLATLIADGQDVGDTLTAMGLARPYDGGTRQGWC